MEFVYSTSFVTVVHILKRVLLQQCLEVLSPLRNELDINLSGLAMQHPASRHRLLNSRKCACARAHVHTWQTYCSLMPYRVANPSSHPLLALNSRRLVAMVARKSQSLLSPLIGGCERVLSSSTAISCAMASAFVCTINQVTMAGGWRARSSRNQLNTTFSSCGKSPTLRRDHDHEPHAQEHKARAMTQCTSASFSAERRRTSFQPLSPPFPLGRPA